MTTYNFPEGELLLINKPATWTSFDVVNRIKKMIKKAVKVKVKVGHAGTLDPLATGLLIVCTGKFTKKIDEYQALEKEYTGTFTIGATTPSFDGETLVDKTYPVEHITNEAIIKASEQFIGETGQIPPIYSAMKIDGERAYRLARRGEETEIKSRTIFIREFEITDVRSENELLYVDFRVICSKGTYIRSLARDFGVALGSGAYLTRLCRTKIGDFILKNSLTLDELKDSIVPLEK